MGNSNCCERCTKLASESSSVSYAARSAGTKLPEGESAGGKEPAALCRMACCRPMRLRFDFDSEPGKCGSADGDSRCEQTYALAPQRSPLSGLREFDADGGGGCGLSTPWSLLPSGMVHGAAAAADAELGAVAGCVQLGDAPPPLPRPGSIDEARRIGRPPAARPAVPVGEPSKKYVHTHSRNSLIMREGEPT